MTNSEGTAKSSDAKARATVAREAQAHNATAARRRAISATDAKNTHPLSARKRRWPSFVEQRLNFTDQRTVMIGFCDKLSGRKGFARPPGIAQQHQSGFSRLRLDVKTGGNVVAAARGKVEIEHDHVGMVLAGQLESFVGPA